MKKFLAIIMVMVLALSIVACGKVDPAKDLENVKKAGKLKIGYTVYQPMNYTNDKGEFVGFDTEYAQAVCKKLGVEPEFIEINWDTKEIELKSGKIDCIWNGFTISEERKQQVDFSASYIKNKQVVVIKKDNAEKYKDTASLASAKIVAETESAGQTAIEADKDLKNAEFKALGKQTDCLMNVSAGKSEACVIDLTLAQAQLKEDADYSDLMIVESINLTDEEYGIGFRKGSTLTEEINKITKELIADGTMAKIAEKYDMSDILVK